MSQSSAPNQRSRRLSTLALAVVATLLSLLLLEVGLRFRAHLENRRLLDGALSPGVALPADGPAELGHIIRLSPEPSIVYELKPDLSVLYEGSRVITDANGFRTDGSGRVTSTDAPCIVGIGDSFMFGQGVPGSKTYMAVLEEQLVGHRGRDLRLLNTAVPGYNTVMEVATLEAKGISCRPRVVIVEFVGNDFSLPNFVWQPTQPWSPRRSFLGDFVKERLGAPRDQSLFRRLLDAGLLGVPQDAAGMGTVTEPALVPPAYRHLVGWDAYAAAMRRLRDLSRQHGFDVVSISLGPGDWPLKTRALELSRELGFHVVDVGAAFDAYLEANGYPDYMGSPLALGPDDGHPSILAHRIAGDVLADYIDMEVLPER